MRSILKVLFLISLISFMPFALGQSGRPLNSTDTEHPGTSVPPAPTDPARPSIDRSADGTVKLPGSTLNMSPDAGSSKVTKSKKKKSTSKQKQKKEDEVIFPNDSH